MVIFTLHQRLLGRGVVVCNPSEGLRSVPGFIWQVAESQGDAASSSRTQQSSDRRLKAPMSEPLATH